MRGTFGSLSQFVKLIVWFEEIYPNKWYKINLLISESSHLSQTMNSKPNFYYIINTNFFQVFWLNIAKNEVYWCYRYCLKLFGKMRKEIEFRQQCCRNYKKKWGERKLNFGNEIIKILVLSKLGGVLERENNCDNQVTEIVGMRREKIWIVATKLLKMGGKKKELWQPSCRKWRKKKRDTMSTTFLHHFHHKLQAVSCYWFKFEANTKITFLPQ